MALIDRVTGIMYCGDDEEIFMDILGMYVQLVSESRQVLAEALFENRMEDYIRRVHAVKSNSRSVGALAVGDLAEKIERAARESRKADVMEDHQELIRMLPYLVTIIVLIVVSLRRKKEDQPPEALGLSYFREDR